MKTFCVSFLSILFLFSCHEIKKPSVDQLIQVDREFSAFSVERGWKSAFLHYAHSDAVLLRENSMPIVEKDAIVEHLGDTTKGKVQLIWEPISGKISQSGELGFTYGTYQLVNDTTKQEGTYVTIWQKDMSGNWKYLLDSGNEGLGIKKD